MAGASPAMTSLTPWDPRKGAQNGAETWPRKRPALAFIAPKSLVKREIPLRHGGCGKQILGETRNSRYNFG
jgi:hypothetical protein